MKKIIILFATIAVIGSGILIFAEHKKTTQPTIAT